MSRKYSSILLVLVILFLTLAPSRTLAVQSCESIGITYSTNPAQPIPFGLSSVTVNFTGQTPETRLSDGQYKLKYHVPQGLDWNSAVRQVSNGNLSLVIDNKNFLLKKEGGTDYILVKNNQEYCSISIEIERSSAPKRNSCSMSLQPSNPTETEQINIFVTNTPQGQYSILLVGDGGPRNVGSITIGSNNTGRATVGPFNAGKYNVKLRLSAGSTIIEDFCSTPLNVTLAGAITDRPDTPICSTNPSAENITKLSDVYVIAHQLTKFRHFKAVLVPTGQDAKDIPDVANSGQDGAISINLGRLKQGEYTVYINELPRMDSPTGTQVCDPIKFTVGTPSPPGTLPGSAGKRATAGGEPCDNKTGIKTAIGCIHTNPAEFAKDFLRFAIGIGGGLAFLMMLLGAFQMLTSAGNPDSLKAGQDRLTSAVIGLLFVIFATLFLQIIGVGILNIPGFK